MPSLGLKASLPGKDITSEDPQDFVFNSENDYNIKIVKQDGGQETISAGSYKDVTIAHNLDFIPMVMMFIQADPDNNQWRFGCHFNNSQDAHIDNDGNNTYVDDTNLHFRIYNGFGSQKTIKYYYFIFGDTAS